MDPAAKLPSDRYACESLSCCAVAAQSGAAFCPVRSNLLQAPVHNTAANSDSPSSHDLPKRSRKPVCLPARSDDRSALPTQPAIDRAGPHQDRWSGKRSVGSMQAFCRWRPISPAIPSLARKRLSHTYRRFPKAQPHLSSRRRPWIVYPPECPTPLRLHQSRPPRAPPKRDVYHRTGANSARSLSKRRFPASDRLFSRSIAQGVNAIL